MRFYSETLGLTENAFTLLRDLIHEKLGLYFENGKRDILADKLSPKVIEAGFDSFLDYYYLLKYDESARNEWKNVMDALSVQETYFWREIDQIKALADVLMPEYGGKNYFRPVRIWSAACASGEEPLTIAMVLQEAGWFDRFQIEIYASDASPSAIDKAMKGVYRERSFRNIPITMKQKYFVEEPGGWKISSLIHDRVKWNVANLMNEDETREFARADIIYCRNVFIYFSPKTIQKTAGYFYGRMPAPGYLFLGASESLLKVSTGFELEEKGGAFVYVKRVRSV